MTRVSRVKASNPRISTQQVTPGQVTPVRRVNAPEAPALPHPSPQSGTVLNSITCNPRPRATLVISANTTVLPCSSVSPGQVSPVARGNTPKLSSVQTSQATAASFSSLSATTQANTNKDNNSFKRLDCTPPLAFPSTKQAVSTSLSTGTGSQVASIFPPFPPTSDTYSPSLNMQPPASSPCFRNSRNCYNTPIVGSASSSLAPA